jgi:hypothetical protein
VLAAAIGTVLAHRLCPVFQLCRRTILAGILPRRCTAVQRAGIRESQMLKGEATFRLNLALSSSS